MSKLLKRLDDWSFKHAQVLFRIWLVTAVVVILSIALYLATR